MSNWKKFKNVILNLSPGKRVKKDGDYSNRTTTILEDNRLKTDGVLATGKGLKTTKSPVSPNFLKIGEGPIIPNDSIESVVEYFKKTLQDELTTSNPNKPEYEEEYPLINEEFIENPDNPEFRPNFPFGYDDIKPQYLRAHVRLGSAEALNENIRVNMKNVELDTSFKGSLIDFSQGGLQVLAINKNTTVGQRILLSFSLGKNHSFDFVGKVVRIKEYSSNKNKISVKFENPDKEKIEELGSLIGSLNHNKKPSLRR